MPDCEGAPEMHVDIGAFYLVSPPRVLMKDFWQVVKVADFGVARVQAQSGIMTAETGTYRWMAPEVRAAPHTTWKLIFFVKCDIFNFDVTEQ